MLLNINSYITEPNCTPAVRAAMDDVDKLNADGLFFPAGEYHFYAGGTVERCLFFSNNDSGLKRVVFFLENRDNFTLCGENAVFIFHGRLCPLTAINCNTLHLSGFAIDFADSFVSDAVVCRVGGDYTDIRISDRHWLENGRLRFIADPWDLLPPFLRLLRFDAAKGEPASDAVDQYCPNQVTANTDGSLRLPQAIPGAAPGDAVAVKHQGRFNPGLVIDRCRDITVENVTVHHAGGMGFLAQCSENLTLDRFNVTPSPRFKRLVAVSDDAAHFVDCRGKVTLENCLLEQQWDDALNVHGVYRRLRRRDVGEMSFFFLEAGHFQQLGIEAVRRGDQLELIKNDTLQPYAVMTVKSCRPLNDQITEVEFVEPLPPENADGDCARNLAAAALELTVRNSTIRRNKPRGILVSGIGRTEITGNYFHTAGAAIYISGDANFWFEAGPVTDVLIRDNVFDECNFVRNCTGDAAITIHPELVNTPEDFHYHRNIRIENNTFHAASPCVISALSVDSLRISDNTVLPGNAPRANNYPEICHTVHCRNILNTDCPEAK